MVGTIPETNDRLYRWIVGQPRALSAIQTLANGKRPEQPCWVEIHCAGLEGCWNRCRHCTGQIPWSLERPCVIPLSGLKRCLDAIKFLGIPMVVLSGNRTEPLLHPDFDALMDAVRARGLATGLHTSGLQLTSRRASRLTSDAVEGDNVAFSIDSFNNETYEISHRAGPRCCQRPFDSVVENARCLAAGKSRPEDPPFITWKYLWLNGNLDQAGVECFVRLAKESGANRVRFAAPLPPVHEAGRLRGFRQISEEEFWMATDWAEKAKQVVGETATFTVEIVRVPPLTDHAEPRFSRCWHAELMAVVGRDGLIYPCTSVASPLFEHLAYGTCADLAKAWEDRPPIRVPEDCSGLYCDRFERFVNEWIEEHLAIYQMTSSKHTAVWAIHAGTA